ncbi:MAG: UbiX family flavin prenyltransferase [Chitinophagaceae bacterium]
MSKKLVVAITGASGSIYAKNLFNQLLAIQHQWQQIGVVMSKNAKEVWQTEIGDSSYEKYPFTFYDKYNFQAPFASGSAQYDTMIVVPCSMGTLGRIAAGVSDDLITRAADVVLKERRKLILVTRETPLNLIHIKNMETVTLAGGVICPAVPSFYSLPKTIDEIAATVVNRVLDLAGFQTNSYRWGGN